MEFQHADGRRGDFETGSKDGRSEALVLQQQNEHFTQAGVVFPQQGVFVAKEASHQQKPILCEKTVG